MNDRINYILSILSTIPEKPGCYQYFDSKGTIIYVGKAKNLRRRVSSYFQKEHDDNKTRVLVRNIYDLKYIVVDSEEDALLLENSLIKQYRPRYNVLLKDDKTYPSIVIKNEYFPRIFQTRNIIKDGSLYYGPYASAYAAKIMLQLIKDLYSIRTCKHTLTPESIAAGKFKVCLEYHIKRCKAPCIGLQKLEEYNENISEIKEILKGNSSRISELLLDEMKTLSSEMRFEEAQIVKHHYDLIDNFRSKSTIVPMLHNVDVFSIDENEISFFINFMHIGNGSIVQVYTIEYKKRLDEPKEEILGLGIVELRERFHSNAAEIIVPFMPDGAFSERVTFTIPQRGDKKKLLDLSLQNAKQYKMDKLKRSEKFNPEQKSVRLMKEIQDQLKLPKLPMQIECFDNSNISGSDAVAACVVFVKAKPSKKDYRKYNIKTVEGPDDYASMQEVVRRRYSRAIAEDQPLPDLIITDGGKGQMEVVRKVVEDELHLQIPIAGLAKDNRHHTSELLYGFPPDIIGLKQNSALFHLLEQMQNEVHRFAISFHRDKRSKRQIASALDSIKGIGEKTKEALLKKYKSVKRISEVPRAELVDFIGSNKADILLEALKNS